MTPFHHLDPTSVPADAALVWPWRPNWATLPVERLEWRTTVHTNQDSTEQRRALRVEPRLSMSYSYLLEQPDAAVALSLLRAWQGKTWAAPVWWAASKLTAGSPTDTLALSRATSTLWQAGSRGMVYTSPATLECFTVESVTTSGLVLTAALVGTWAAGATVVPLHFADLPESQAVSAPVGEVLRMDITFDVRPGLTPVLAEPADGTAWTDTFPTGTAATDPRNHLLGLEHNWTDGASLTVSFPNDVYDPGLGLLSKRPAGEVPSTSWSVRLLAESDAAVARMRQFAAAHRGRAVGFYALSPALDVESASVVDGVVSLPSLRFHPRLETAFAGVSHVAAGARMAEAAIFTSTNATVASGSTFTLRKPRLVSPARLASDAIEITHHTLGVAEVVFPVISTPDTRAVGEGGLGTAYLIVDPDALGWPGVLVGCVPDNGSLVFIGAGTWASLPLTWGAWLDWPDGLMGSIIYEHSAIDALTSAPTRVHVNPVASGTVITEYASSPDGSTYSAWASVPIGIAVTDRYFKIRLTVSGSYPALHSAIVTLYR